MVGYSLVRTEILKIHYLEVSCHWIVEGHGIAYIAYIWFVIEVLFVTVVVGEKFSGAGQIAACEHRLVVAACR